MKILKFFIFAVISINVFGNCASAQNKSNRAVGRANEATKGKPGKIRDREPPQNAAESMIKIIAAGSHSSVETPFVFVARSPESFAQLQKLVENLPTEKIDFSKTAVVAAFAGEKNMGGYSVNIEQNADKISVKVAAPPKGGMVTQVITAPFAVALVAIDAGNSLNLDLPADFSRALKKYRLTSSEFNVSGGIAGINKNFGATGTIGVLQFGSHVTLMFDLTGKANENRRRLNEAVSGTIDGEKVNFARLETGNFIEGPHPSIIANGTLSKEKLSLAFESGKNNNAVSDGFSGNGKIEAVPLR